MPVILCYQHCHLLLFSEATSELVAPPSALSIPLEMWESSSPLPPSTSPLCTIKWPIPTDLFPINHSQFFFPSHSYSHILVYCLLIVIIWPSYLPSLWLPLTAPMILLLLPCHWCVATISDISQRFFLPSVEAQLPEKTWGSFPWPGSACLFVLFDHFLPWILCLNISCRHPNVLHYSIWHLECAPDACFFHHHLY